MFGLLSSLCVPAGLLCNMLGLPYFIAYILYAAPIAIAVPEGIRLAKAFGKGTVFGVLLAVPGFKQIGRIILGLGKAKFHAPETEAAA